MDAGEYNGAWMMRWTGEYRGVWTWCGGDNARSNRMGQGEVSWPMWPNVVAKCGLHVQRVWGPYRESVIHQASYNCKWSLPNYYSASLCFYFSNPFRAPECAGGTYALAIPSHVRPPCSRNLVHNIVIASPEQMISTSLSQRTITPSTPG